MIAVQQAGRPRSRSYEIMHKIAGRYETRLINAFLAATTAVKRGVDREALVRALASGKVTPELLARLAVGSRDIAWEIVEQGLAREAIFGTIQDASRTSLEMLSAQLGFPAQFNAVDPNSVMAAREEIAQLATTLSDDVLNATRFIASAAQSEGLTPQTQARAIQRLIGLPDNWMSAPGNLAQDILNGDVAKATSRRLSAVDKARIRKAIADEAVTEEFLEDIQETYTQRLIRARANTIARDVTSHAAVEGQRMGWKQAIDAGELPDTTRRYVIVTPDDRLRDTHAAIPGMNPNGKPIDEPFDTPFGPVMSPPFEPNCRCGVGLLFNGNIL